MDKNFIFVCLAVVTTYSAVGIHGASVDAKDSSSRFIFLGEYKNPTTIEDTSTLESHPQSSLYFLSQNAAAFANAEIDCKAYLGPDATLIYIETAGELAVIAKFLSNSDDTGSSYWIGGKFDIITRKFVWGNNVDFGNWSPWETGYPDTHLPVTRVVAHKAGGLKLRTQFQTVSNRYICELHVGVRGNSGPKYLGHYKSSKAETNIQGLATREMSFYFLSQNAAGFQTSEMDCKAFLGLDATLLLIETEEKLRNITELFSRSDNTGSSYWIGGKYDTPKRTFVWLNGVEFGPWAPWDVGMPNTRTQLTRVSMLTAGSVRFRTQFQTVSNRYICEIKAESSDPEDVIPCYNDNDLVIAVDSSGSIGSENFKVALEFAVRLSTAWADYINNSISVLVYSDSAESIINLSDKLGVNEIRDRVYKAPYLDSSTASDLALESAVEEFLSNQRSVPKNLVFMTDGVSNAAERTVEAAKRVHDTGIRSFSVGIGHSVNQTELLAIAGNKHDHVFNTEGFADLLKFLQPVSRKVCS